MADRFPAHDEPSADHSIDRRTRGERGLRPLASIMGRTASPSIHTPLSIAWKRT
jgi:hypothetical protein